MAASPQDVGLAMRNAIQLDNQGKFAEAEECYTQAIFLLRQALQRPDVDDNAKRNLMNYMSDVAKRIQRIRVAREEQQQQRTAATAHRKLSSGQPRGASSSSSASTCSTPQPVNSSSSNSGGGGGAAAGADYLDLLYSDPKFAAEASRLRTAGSPSANRQTSGASPPPPRGAPGSGSSLPPPPAALKSMEGLGDVSLPEDADNPPVMPAATGPKLNAKKDSPSPPPPLSNKYKLSDYYVPHASDFVMKAIDVATKLSNQGELKRAVDVLDHAYQVGRRQRNNPSNFKNIESTLEFMREKYYKANPPRFLQDNPVLPEEMDVLRRSGITTSLLLPMWDDVGEGYGATNVFMPCEGTWEDNFNPTLCATQKQKGAQLLHVDKLPNKDQLAILKEADPMNVQQTVVGDCSMVCSLIICASYQKRFPKAKIISTVIYPQALDGAPILNPKGAYCVKMLVNGMTRVVSIDDRFPIQPRTHQLLTTVSKDPDELWVPMMEKAFVKICGGSYEFPGSSSASDLYKLSGWLPDSLNFKANAFDSDFQWKRLHHCFRVGAVLLTVATPDPETAEDGGADGGRWKLPSNHAYAVLDIREVEGQRVFLVRNPWNRFTWSGALSLEDKSPLAAKVHQALDYTQELAQQGVFCISWADLIRHFSRSSLSWNPYMLYPTSEGMSRRPTRLACHGVFHYTTSMGAAPQLHIGIAKAPKVTRMHLVLSRHITDVTEFKLQYEKDNPAIPFLAVKVYDVTAHPSVAHRLANGRCYFGRCYCRRLASASDLTSHMQPLNEVISRNYAAHTVSFDCPAGTSHLVVVVTRDESSVTTPFPFSATLHTELEQMKLPTYPGLNYTPSTLLERANFDAGNPSQGVFMHAIPKASLRHVTVKKGAWVRGKSCGGRIDASTFVFNPQYALHLEKPAFVSLRLTTEDCAQPSQVQLVRKRASLLSGCPAAQLPPFALRIGNVNTEADFCMQAKLYGYKGAAVDSALVQTLCFDNKKLLGERAVKESRKIKVKISGGGGTASAASTASEFYVYDVDEADEVGVVLLTAVRKGFLVSPRSSTFLAGSKAVPLAATLEQAMAAALSVEDETDNGLRAAATASRRTMSFEVQLKPSATPNDATDFPKGSDAWGVLHDLQDLCTDVLRCTSLPTTFLPAIGNLARRADTVLTPQNKADKASSASPVARTFVAEMCVFLADYVQRLATRPRNGQVADSLPPLPAGDYVVIPSLWKKGVAGGYELTCETTEPHTLQLLPEEGANYTEKRINGQLLPEGGYLRSKQLTPPQSIAKSDSLFRNSKVSITLTARSVLTARLFLLEDAEDAETSKRSSAATFANISLFRVRDAVTMEMIGGSGSYTGGGACIAPLVLEAQTTYLLVVSASSASSAKYLLRIYSNNNGLSAQLAN